MKHPCEIITDCLAEKPVYGNMKGTCRITGKEGEGIEFNKWVKDTFCDFMYLYPGEIISNEALFCFDEKSELIQKLTGREKLQRFRTYSHFVVNGKWHLLTKADKAIMWELLFQKPDLAVISESGQKHLVMKAKPGTWQLEETIIEPDENTLKGLQKLISRLNKEIFAIDEIRTGEYAGYRIQKFGIENWRKIEQKLKQYRGSKIFDLALFFSKITE